jgi:imidazolonepropionase-like amidohydrolase
VDVRTGEAREGVSLVVRGERLAAVLPAGAPLPSGAEAAEVVDVAGLWAVPGLVDSHAHVALWHSRRMAEAALRRELFGGVTHVRDMTGDARLLGYLSRATRGGEVAGPDVSFAALVAGPSFFEDARLLRYARGGAVPGQVPWSQAVTDGSDLPLLVARAKGTGASALKVYANLEAPLVARLTREAHRQGLQVWAHGAVFPARPSELVSARVDSLSHVCMLGYEVTRPHPRTYHRRAPVDAAALAGEPTPPPLAALFSRMQRQGVVLDTTLWLYEEIERMRAEPGEEQHKPPTYCSAEVAGRLTRQAARAGVPLAAGTDATAPSDSPWPALHAELEALQRRAGLSPLEALRAATLGGARALGLERELGTVEEGKLASVVFLREDPRRDVAALRSVVLTLKRGRPFPRAQFVPPTREELEGAPGEVP